ncbi:hypothetical protein ACFL2U_00740 [Patescibacteria group bacterium]
MEIGALRLLAGTNPEEALLIAWEQDVNHSLADEITSPEVIVELTRSRNERVSSWAYVKISSADFPLSLDILKTMSDRSRPWETALSKTLDLVQTIEQFEKVAKQVDSYDVVWLFSCAKRVLQATFSKAETKKDFIRLLEFVEYLSELDLKLSCSAYGRQFDYDKCSRWQQQIQEKLFELVKGSKRDLLGIVRDDKFHMKRSYGQQATTLLAQM